MDETNYEMRLIKNGTNAHRWNNSFSEHMAKAECETPKLAVHTEMKKGLGWKQSLRCVNCSYKSRLYKLYSEVSNAVPGAKRASCNVGLQVCLHDTPHPICNTPPPAREFCQYFWIKALSMIGGARYECKY